MVATDAPYEYDGESLEIPLAMLSDSAVSSTWQRVEGEAEAPLLKRLK